MFCGRPSPRCSEEDGRGCAAAVSRHDDGGGDNFLTQQAVLSLGAGRTLLDPTPNLGLPHLISFFAYAGTGVFLPQRFRWAGYAGDGGQGWVPRGGDPRPVPPVPKLSPPPPPLANLPRAADRTDRAPGGRGRGCAGDGAAGDGRADARPARARGARSSGSGPNDGGGGGRGGGRGAFRAAGEPGAAAAAAEGRGQGEGEGEGARHKPQREVGGNTAVAPAGGSGRSRSYRTAEGGD